MGRCIKIPLTIFYFSPTVFSTVQRAAKRFEISKFVKEFRQFKMDTDGVPKWIEKSYCLQVGALQIMWSLPHFKAMFPMHRKLFWKSRFMSSVRHKCSVPCSEQSNGSRSRSSSKNLGNSKWILSVFLNGYCSNHVVYKSVLYQLCEASTISKWFIQYMQHCCDRARARLLHDLFRSGNSTESPNLSFKTFWN